MSAASSKNQGVRTSLYYSFIKHDNCFALCSGGETKPAGKTLSSHPRHLVSKTISLESQVMSSKGFGPGVSPSLPFASTSQVDA